MTAQTPAGKPSTRQELSLNIGHFIFPAAGARRPRVRTAWQVDQGQSAPRFITAYPLEAIP